MKTIAKTTSLLLSIIGIGVLLTHCATTSGISPAPSSSGSSTGYAERAKNDRPGLGTGWGDHIDSSIRETSFVRGTSEPHGGLSTIYYNDREGIRSMTNGRMYRTSGMQRAAGGLVEWGIKSGWSTLPTYRYRGRRYVEGRAGSSYKIAVRNISRDRVEVVASVDGLDVIDGRTASIKKRGHIIAPGQTIEIAGFRKGYDSLAAFEFSSVSGSYSNQRHGQSRNVGVIGLAVYPEQNWRGGDNRRRYDANPFAEAP